MQIGVIGCGLMGSQLTLLSSIYGHKIIVYANTQSKEADYKARILSHLENPFWIRAQKKQNKTWPDILSQIGFTNAYNKFNDCDIIFETVSENLKTKQEVIRGIAQNLVTQKTFCTCTSSYSAAQIKIGLANDTRLVCTHFFNPFVVSKAVEVSDNVEAIELKTIRSFFCSLDKEIYIVPNKPGLLANHIILAFINQAIYQFFEIKKDPSIIDQLIKQSCNMPLGPLELSDLIGNDTVYLTLSSLYNSTQNENFKPHPSFHKMITENQLGKKSRHGFYKY